MNDSMNENQLPDFIIAGTQKCATTWLYKCLYEHPDVFLPETDSVHYFDMNFHKGIDWYHSFFSDHDGEQLVGEETPSYIREQAAPRRMNEVVPDAKLLFCVRNPIDRAYSHYWHERSKDKIEFEFDEIFENYDLYQNWIVPGFYARHLDRYEEYYDSDDIKVLFFDDLVDDEWDYLQQAYEFLGIDDNYEPSLLDSKVNEARHDMPAALRYVRDVVRETAPKSVVDSIRPAYRQVKRTVFNRSEYEKGMEPETRERLGEIFESDVRRLESRTGRDLDHWLE